VKEEEYQSEQAIFIFLWVNIMVFTTFGDLMRFVFLIFFIFFQIFVFVSILVGLYLPLLEIEVLV